MKKTSTLATMLAAALAFPFAAQADTEKSYVKLSAGDMRTDIDDVGKESATAVSLAYGMPMTEMFDVEVGYINFGTAKYRGAPGYGLDAKSESVYLAAVGKLPLGSGFSAFGKLGASYHRNKLTYTMAGVPGTEKDNRLAPLIGIGLSYQFTDALAADLEFTHFNRVGSENGSDADINLVALGLRYAF